MSARMASSRTVPPSAPIEGLDVDVATVELAPFFTGAFLDYARETVMDRAVPDVRDGLKPSQRRILFVMHELGLRSDQPTKKCARIVGDTLGRYHPHGDTAVYDTLVRMAQDFVLRLPLVDGQGNFGDGDDRAAAYRYTEARLTAAAEALMQDLDMGTVDWVPNFDNTMQEPVVLPAAIPNLLVNGTMGVACGMATSMPPHNLGEVCQAIVHMAQHWRRRAKITVDDLLEIIPGPDFPTGGTAFRYRGEGDEFQDTIRRAYEQGKGSIVIQAQVEIESGSGGKSRLVIHELPYGVKKGLLMRRVALAVQDGKVTGVTDLRDESDHTGMRVVVELSRQAEAADVAQQLIRQGILKKTFSVRNLALVPGDDGIRRPQYLSLRDLLEHFVRHRLDVIVRRTRYELERRQARLHIVEGLLRVLDVLDEVIETIRRSQSPDTAKRNLMRKWKFSELQSQAILDMQLRRLTALERNKLQEEARELQSRIQYLQGLLASEKKRLQVVIEETTALSERFSTARRTIIIDREDLVAGTVVTKTDLVLPDQPQVLLLTAAGLQRLDQADYSFKPTRSRPRQPIEPAEVLWLRRQVDPDAEVLLLSDQGRGWRGQVGFLPRTATPAELGLAREERLVGLAVLPREAGEDCLVLGTSSGKVKRTRVADLRLLDRQWGPVIGLAEEEDWLLFGDVAGAGAHVVFYTAQGQVLRIDGDTVNPQQTDTARGVAGIGLRDGDRVLGGAVVPQADQVASQWWVVVISQRGYMHQSPLSEFPVQGRGAGGVRALRPSKRGGEVATLAVGPGEVVDVYLENGRRQRLLHKDIPVTARDALGERIAQVDQVGVRRLVLIPG